MSMKDSSFITQKKSLFSLTMMKSLIPKLKKYHTVPLAKHLDVFRAFSGGCAIAHTHAGTRPNVCLGAIDCAPGNEIFPLKRTMSHSGVDTGKLCRQIDFHSKTYLVTP